MSKYNEPEPWLLTLRKEIEKRHMQESERDESDIIRGLVSTVEDMTAGRLNIAKGIEDQEMGQMRFEMTAVFPDMAYVAKISSDDGGPAIIRNKKQAKFIAQALIQAFDVTLD